MEIPIVKAHGAANDFVLVEDLGDELDVPVGLVARICDRRRGVGADGFIRIAPGQDAGVFMDYRNADGSLAEICGNGIRCLAKYCFDRGILVGTEADIDTRAGVKHVVVHPDAAGKVAQVEVDMGPPQLDAADIPVKTDGSPLEMTLAIDGVEYDICAAGMGNPHAVVFVDDVSVAPVTTLGPRIETDPAFPEGTNVEFVHVADAGRIEMRVWERGSGETLACGSGACAAAAVSNLTGRAGGELDVVLRGGTLHITVGDTVVMRGPAVEVFETILDTARLARL